MLLNFSTPKRCFAALAILVCASAWAATGPEPVGLAVYTDTGRDIYIAGLHTADGEVPQDLSSVPAPVSMEYRISTRRISSRGFSGTMLLQAELGSGQRAPNQVVLALDELKQVMQGSFLQGDHFQIRKTADGATTFYLNGEEVVAVDDSSVFDFLLSGWVGESSSALFRDSLLSGSVKRDTLERYEALAPSAERIETIASWMEAGDEEAEQEQVAAAPEKQPAEPAKAAAAASATAVAAAPAPAPAPKPAAPKPAAPEPVAAPKPEPQVAKAEPVPKPEAQVAKAEPVPKPEAQVAKAEPVPKPEPQAEPKPAPEPAPEPVAETQKPQVAAAPAKPAPEPALAAAENMDDREYKRQLSEYVSQVMNKVLRQVVYPNRAVRRQNEGNVELLAQLGEDGQLLEVSLGTSSGYKLLDGAALKAVQQAAPFPELTPVAMEEFGGGDGEGYVMTIPVRFELFD